MKRSTLALAALIVAVSALTVVAGGARRGGTRSRRRSRRRGSTSARTTTAAGRRRTTRAGITCRRRSAARSRRPSRRTCPRGRRSPGDRRASSATGNKIIFATSFGFQDAMKAAAKKHPDVKFEMATGTARRRTWPSTSARARTRSTSPAWPPARRRRSGTIGYVVPFAIPEVIRHANAFALGAQATHPGVKVKLVWTNSWFDPAKERKAAESLRAAGADVLGQNVDSPAAGQYAESAGIPWVGYDSNAMKFAPKQWLTAAVYNWGPYYLKRVKAAMKGTWKTGFYYGSMKDGFAKLAPFGPKVDREDAGARSRRRRHAIVSGTFYEFAGPLYDQSGKLRVPKGKRLSVQGPVRDGLARQGRDRQRQGLVTARGAGAGTRPGRRRAARRRCRGRAARDHQALPGRRRERRRRLRGGRGRGARAARRERRRQDHALEHPDRPLPARRGRDPARRPAGRLPLAARRDRGRDLDGAPALPARDAVHGRRERRPRRPRGEGATFRVHPRAIERRVAELGERYGIAVDPRAKLWQLSLGEQQRVEILKALYREARILILDEPTAVLTPQEADVALRDAAADGRRGADRDLHLAQAARGEGGRPTASPCCAAGKPSRPWRPRTRRRASLAALMVGREVATARRRARAGRGTGTRPCSRSRASGRRRRPRRARRCAASSLDAPARRDPRRRGRRRQRAARARRGDHRPARADGRDDSASREAAPRRRPARGDRARASRTFPRTGSAPASRRASAILGQRRAQVLPPAGVVARAAAAPGARSARRAAELIRRYDVRGAGPGHAGAAALGRQPAEGRARRASSRATRRVLVAASPTRGLDVSAIETVHALPARGRRSRRRGAPDQRGPRRDPGARGPRCRHLRGRRGRGGARRTTSRRSAC